MSWTVYSTIIKTKWKKPDRKYNISGNHQKVLIDQDQAKIFKASTDLNFKMVPMHKLIISQ